MIKYNFFWIQDGKMKNSSKETPEEAIQKFMTGNIEAITPYAVSSVERNMFKAHLREATEILQLDETERKKIEEKIEKHLELTPYTNWSGD